MNKWMKGKKLTKKKMMQNVGSKSETKKETEQKQKMKIFWLSFLWF